MICIRRVLCFVTLLSVLAVTMGCAKLRELQQVAIFEVKEPNLKVVIDEDQLSPIMSPCRIQISPGEHTISISKGHKPIHFSFQAETKHTYKLCTKRDRSEEERRAEARHQNRTPRPPGTTGVTWVRVWWIWIEDVHTKEVVAGKRPGAGSLPGSS